MKLILALSFLLVFASISCGFATPPPVPTPNPTWPPFLADEKVVRLDIVNKRSREHYYLEILPNTTIIWLHDDSQLHNVRHTRHINDSVNKFKSANYAEGEEFRVKFDEVGEWRYFCEVHGGHSYATIYVVDEFGTSPLNEQCSGTMKDHDDGRICDWTGRYDLSDIENLYSKYNVVTPHDHTDG